MGLISPELLAQLNINLGGKKTHFHMKKYELEFIDTARKKVQLSSIYMSKIISLMLLLIHGFYFVTVLDGDHIN